MQPAIEIRNLGKEYKLAAYEPYLSLRDVITRNIKNALSGKKKTQEKFWALKDINLDIMPGERVGVIGRNGAGKSTLLKIISRITPPTIGEAIIRGRVGSLLEVGTGFHPELTGRENIYLNGSILGLKKAEIDKQMDPIVDFSGVERFIDSPLKHYSSGMQMRLAFSVAAHLQSEILLIDEVLAVGDIEFQKKCLGKMEEVSQQEGRTVLFVSHNMNYIASLCDKAILLDQGKMIKTGGVTDIISMYTKKIIGMGSETTAARQSGDDIVVLRKVRPVTCDGQEKHSFSTAEKTGIEMQYEVLQPGHVLWIGYTIHNNHGVHIFDTHSVKTSYYNEPHPTGLFTATVWIHSDLLNTGTYFVSGAIFNHLKQTIHFYERDVCVFNVYDDIGGITAKGNSPGDLPGAIRPLLHWEIKKTNE